MDPSRTILLNFPADLSFVANSPLTQNYTLLMENLQQINNHTVVNKISELDYEKFVSDIWIGIVLSFVIVFTVFSMCTCLMYHKFQQWKINYNARLAQRNSESGYPNYDIESLPNYSLVSGLPTYDAALEQYRKDKSHIHNEKPPVYSSLKKLYIDPASSQDDAETAARVDYLQVKEAIFKYHPQATVTKKRFSIAVSSGDLLSKALWPAVQQGHELHGETLIPIDRAHAPSQSTDFGDSGAAGKIFQATCSRIVQHRASMF